MKKAKQARILQLVLSRACFILYALAKCRFGVEACYQPGTGHDGQLSINISLFLLI